MSDDTKGKRIECSRTVSTPAHQAMHELMAPLEWAHLEQRIAPACDAAGLPPGTQTWIAMMAAGVAELKVDGVDVEVVVEIARILYRAIKLGHQVTH